MRVNAAVECEIRDSFHVRQVAGMFDVTLAEKVRREFNVELPNEEEEWQIGAIVGPSGSGKTTVAREAFGDALYSGHQWPDDKAVVDCFGERPMKEITQMLTAVGFSSPPAWIRTYQTLSNGERFRCELAQALLSDDVLVVFDEFTSVVDRTVAQIGSAAVSKAVRRGKGRFVAVTCHYDVLPWLEPDWVLDMSSDLLERRRLRRPVIELEVFRCQRLARGIWQQLFAPHHYLSAELGRTARCYVATWRDELVAFCALYKNAGRNNIWRISRIVVLPDYQGVGIGVRVCEALAKLYADDGMRMTITTSHIAMIGYLRRSKSWRVSAVHSGGTKAHSYGERGQVKTMSAGRAVLSAEYVGGKT